MTTTTATTPTERLAAESGPRQKGQWPCTLAAARKRHGLKLRQVAPAVRVTIGHLSRLELGLSLPSLPVAIRLARFFGAGVADLWPLADGDDDPAGGRE